MKKKIITTIIAVASLTMTSCGHDTNIDKSEQNTAVQKSSTTTSLDESSIEATSSAALTVKMEADMYFAENPILNKVIHGYFNNDKAFGSEILKRHPALEGLEYIVELNNDNNAINVFLCQPNTNPMSISCNGKYDKIDDWGFETWEDVLNHYNLESLES